MNRIIAISFLLLLSGAIKSQNMIGYHSDDIKKIMRETQNEFRLNNDTKNEYYNYLVSIDKEDEYRDCWACGEAKHNWLNCPITWVKEEIKSKTALQCARIFTIYIKWVESLDKRYFNKQISTAKHAKAMVKLIKETWKD